MIITEYSYIHIQGKVHPSQTSIASNDVIPSFQRITNCIHIRFDREVIHAVRDDFPLALRLSGCDYEAGGSTAQDCVEACRLLEHSGVDLFHLIGVGWVIFKNPHWAD